MARVCTRTEPSRSGGSGTGSRRSESAWPGSMGSARIGAPGKKCVASRFGNGYRCGWFAHDCAICRVPRCPRSRDEANEGMASDDQSAAFELLADPATHGGAKVTRIDTHAACVFLAGAYAFKVKLA